MNDAKTEILRVRMTPMEKAALSRQANDQHKTMSEYIRSIAKCPPEVTRDEFEGSILQMIYEINKIGVNINQMKEKQLQEEQQKLEQSRKRKNRSCKRKR